MKNVYSDEWFSSSSKIIIYIFEFLSRLKLTGFQPGLDKNSDADWGGFKEDESKNLTRVRGVLRLKLSKSW